MRLVEALLRWWEGSREERVSDRWLKEHLYQSGTEGR